MKRLIAIAVTIIILSANIASADKCMRYNHRRICPGDSIADVISLLVKPFYKSDLGKTTGPSGCRNVELWIYQHQLRRWELTVVNGRVLEIKKVRLRRVR